MMGMAKEKRRYILAADAKSYFASVECVDRGLDPLTTNLVVADQSRTDKTICLAVSPSLKACGIPGRPRLFEVVQKVREVNHQRLRGAIRAHKAVKDADGQYHFASTSFDAAALAADPSLGLQYIVAPPRMKRYVEVSALIYATYLKYVSSDSIHQYSIDECFIDLTPYLDLYNMDAHTLSMTMIREVLYATGITATAGIGSNLYLAKIAMDIVAKKAQPDGDGVRMVELDETSFRHLLWDHKPLTDFWHIGSGTARRLEKKRITTMGELARVSLQDPESLYRAFGIDAEILIEQAWGIDPVTMSDIKNYRSQANSYSEGQVLQEPYPWERARIVVAEMADAMVMRLVRHRMVTNSLTLWLGYERVSQQQLDYRGDVYVDHYGRTCPKPVHGTVHLKTPTNLGSQIIPAILAIFDRITDRSLHLRRINMTVAGCVPDEGIYQVNLFDDGAAQEKEKRLQEAMVSIKDRYGKNAILRGISYEEGATVRERNGMIGGHKG